MKSGWLMVVTIPAFLRYLTLIAEARAEGRDAAPPGIEYFTPVGNAWTLFPVIPVLLIAGLRARFGDHREIAQESGDRHRHQPEAEHAGPLGERNEQHEGQQRDEGAAGPGRVRQLREELTGRHGRRGRRPARDRSHSRPRGGSDRCALRQARSP